jgi:hypothetical protein
MKPSHLSRPAVLGLFLATLSVLALPLAAVAEESDTVTISSRASSGYRRTVLADGSVQPETFAFGKGGVFKGETRDPIDAVDFMEVARTVAAPLAGQKYVAATDPKATNLLIMVYWGTTRTPEGFGESAATQELQIAAAAEAAASKASNMVRMPPGTSGWAKTESAGAQISAAVRTPDQLSAEQSMTGAMAMVSAENNRRQQLDAQNASLLGYDTAWNDTAQFEGTGLNFRRQDVVTELEQKRYFVVLMAYDFQAMRAGKGSRLLWETRFSVRRSGNDFSGRLAAMAADAAGYFGRSSNGLVRKALPAGRVEVGPVKTLAYEGQP